MGNRGRECAVAVPDFGHRRDCGESPHLQACFAACPDLSFSSTNCESSLGFSALDTRKKSLIITQRSCCFPVGSGEGQGKKKPFKKKTRGGEKGISTTPGLLFSRVHYTNSHWLSLYHMLNRKSWFTNHNG